MILKVYLYQSMRIIWPGDITSYLAFNVLPVPSVIPVIHSFIMIVDIICINPIASYLSNIVRPIFQAYSYSVYP